MNAIQRNYQTKPALSDTMRVFNPEILSDRPTHFDKKNDRDVKVFTTYEAYRPDAKMFSAEIMSGESKGKGTTVYACDLIQIHYDSPEWANV